VEGRVSDNQGNIRSARAPKRARQVSGKAVCYSPLEFVHRTQVQRQHRYEPELWMTERPVETVYPEGIRLQNEFYNDNLLDTYRTGGTDALRRTKLVIRYDRSLLTRGILEEVSVYRVEGDRKRTFLCVARRGGARLSGYDLNLALQEREAYEAALVEARARAQSTYLSMVHGPDHTERLEEQILARQLWPKKPRRASIRAAPQLHDPEEVLRQIAMQEQAVERMSAEGVESHPEERAAAASHPVRTPTKRKAVQRNASPLASEPKVQQHGNTAAGSTLLDLLGGGPTGITPDSEEE
jgi:hypothetical protein